MPTKITWIAEKEVWLDDEEKRLFEALAKTGSDVIPFTLGETLLNEEVRKIQGPVIGRGSIQFIKRSTSGFPWAYVSWPDFRCSNYYNQFSEFLIHEFFAFLPWGLLQKKKNLIYSVFPDDNSKVFFRPDTNDKIFSGKVVSFDDFEHWYEQENICYSPSKELQCVVSRPSVIFDEWRFVCSVRDTKILGSSRYIKEGPKIDPTQTMDAHQINSQREGAVLKVLSRLSEHPEVLGYPPFIVIDMAETPTGWKLMEFGSVNCCSWYSCDPLPIIRAMEQEAKEEYEKD